jgi:hypothetical protein
LKCFDEPLQGLAWPLGLFSRFRVLIQWQGRASCAIRALGHYEDEPAQQSHSLAHDTESSLGAGYHLR